MFIYIISISFVNLDVFFSFVLCLCLLSEMRVNLLFAQRCFSISTGMTWSCRSAVDLPLKSSVISFIVPFVDWCAVLNFDASIRMRRFMGALSRMDEDFSTSRPAIDILSVYRNHTIIGIIKNSLNHFSNESNTQLNRNADDVLLYIRNVSLSLEIFHGPRELIENGAGNYKDNNRCFGWFNDMPVHLVHFLSGSAFLCVVRGAAEHGRRTSKRSHVSAQEII